MSYEYQSLPNPPAEDLDIEFKAGIGCYLGLILAGVTTIAGIIAGSSTVVLLVTAPSTVKGTLLLALVFGDRLHGLPERIGRSRARRLACYVPAVAFAAVLLSPPVTQLEYTARLSVVTGAFALLTAAVAAGIARMARNRYVDAITADEPSATWTWRRTGFGSGERIVPAITALWVVVGLLSGLAWDWFFGLKIAFYGCVPLLFYWFDWAGTWDDHASTGWNLPTIRAHESGLVLERWYAKKHVPWEAIADVRLTSDELVLERRWIDIRCDRSMIDDPEAVRDGIERARGRSDRFTPAADRSTISEPSD
ncbi:PH domain-containing protein [Natronorubrum halophilum]|uniref:PH domain-containing protein n=1 Tax=Natronorubrum halophilum TaxID=1702106 RepID=UPI000EF67E77|nr:PH domain-containing protein [Natronorubrum halophilum]